jgi:hypothetical protein
MGSVSSIPGKYVVVKKEDEPYNAKICSPEWLKCHKIQGTPCFDEVCGGGGKGGMGSGSRCQMPACNQSCVQVAFMEPNGSHASVMKKSSNTSKQDAPCYQDTDPNRLQTNKGSCTDHRKGCPPFDRIPPTVQEQPCPPTGLMNCDPFDPCGAGRVRDLSIWSLTGILINIRFSVTYNHQEPKCANQAWVWRSHAPISVAIRSIRSRSTVWIGKRPNVAVCRPPELLRAWRYRAIRWLMRRPLQWVYSPLNF